MFPLIFGSTETSPSPLMLYNTLTRTKEAFEPLRSDYVRLYHCGPTVYDYAHIGNLRAFVFADILRRTLKLFGYNVRQVMNITDVGHLTSDADQGEDKMTVGLKREGLELSLEGMRQLADTYTEAFMKDLEAMGILTPQDMPRASEHVPGMVALIETLMQKEYAYETSDGVYFDTKRFAGYGKLGKVDVEAQEEGARVTANPEKRSPADFALWKKNKELGWESPWGKGFPGWHIECSAMSMELLGKQLDIHTGGVDHIGTHHNNEIAQSEASTGKDFARFWMHNEHIHIEGSKIAKSAGNSIKLRQLVEHGYSPLSYRYWLLSGHYRSQMSFSFGALDGAQTALRRLQNFFLDECLDVQKGEVVAEYEREFRDAMGDDLDTPRALALLWKLVKDDAVSEGDKKATLLLFDKTLGLGLGELTKKNRGMTTLNVTSVADLPEEVRALVEEREAARNEKDWARADELRDTLRAKGYDVSDTSEGYVVSRL